MNKKLSVMALALLALCGTAQADNEGVRLSYPVQVNCTYGKVVSGTGKGSLTQPVSAIIERDGKTTVTIVNALGINIDMDFGTIKHVGASYGGKIVDGKLKTIFVITPVSETRTSLILKDLSGDIVTTEIKASDCSISHPTNSTETEDFE